MSELPKFVRERMAGPAPVGEHPDPDLLTAFAEHSLTPTERSHVLAHLATCGSCRDVVALALPQADMETQTAVARPARAWWTWPALRWAAMGASLVVVAAAVLLMRPEAPKPALRVAETQPPSPVAASEPRPQAPRTVPQRSVNKDRARASMPADKTRRAPAKAQTAMAGTSLAGNKSRQQPAQSSRTTQSVEVTTAARLDAAPPPPPPAAAPTPQIAGAARAPAPVETVNAAELAESPQKAEAKTAGVFRGKSGYSADTLNMQVRPATQSGATQRAARWAVSANGAVERSLDSGLTWKAVAIDAAVRFRAVAKVGNEVWAGGSGGALFHSPDGGEHWARVSVPSADDIVRIDFPDPQRGTVTTVHAQTWATADGGRTWTRQ